MKTVADQIKDLENTRAAKAARMNEVMQKSIEEGRSTEAAEAEEFDDLEVEIKQLDDDLVRLHKLQKSLGESAAPVEPEATKAAAAATRGAPMILKAPKDHEESFKGQNFTRMAIAKAVAKKEGGSAADYANWRWGKTNPSLVEIMKAAVPGGGSGSGEWGSELVSADNRYTGDFIEFLTSMTVYDKLPLREIPANVTIKGQDGIGTGYWVGESLGIPASAQDYSSISLTPLKVAAITAVSNELLRDSSPAAEQMVRDALVEAASQRIDTTFVSTTAASAGVSPAGILNNISATTSAGTDGDSLLNDIKELYNRFITARNVSGLWYVMNPALAKAASLLRNALDQREFPTLNASGGTLEGDPVVTGDNVNANHLILLKPSDIWRIGNGGIEISISEHATIEMADDPAGDSETPTAQANSAVGMFQTESTAIKVVRSMNFARRRESAVAYINDATYGGAIST